MYWDMLSSQEDCVWIQDRLHEFQAWYLEQTHGTSSAAYDLEHDREVFTALIEDWMNEVR